MIPFRDISWIIAGIGNLRTRLDGLWDGIYKLLRGFANIS